MQKKAYTRDTKINKTSACRMDEGNANGTTCGQALRTRCAFDERRDMHMFIRLLCVWLSCSVRLRHPLFGYGPNPCLPHVPMVPCMHLFFLGGGSRPR